MKLLILTTYDDDIINHKLTEKELPEIIQILSKTNEWGKVNNLYLFDDDLSFQQHNTTHISGNPVIYDNMRELPNLLGFLKLMNKVFILPFNLPNYKVKKEIVDETASRMGRSKKEYSHFIVDGIQIATYKLGSDLYEDPSSGSMLRQKIKPTRELSWHPDEVLKLTGFRPNTNSKSGDLRNDFPSLRWGYTGSTYTAKTIKIMLESFVIHKQLEKLNK